ncbi:hypothetical protein SDRG_03352 [Saprolegnia diclina VS20]|uniref:TOG domain-containing protein n=1 Tax=Saprolegnia diclina (strain VS20) TaxID=1156394 RepID=T0QWT2_SAPDV|nr:hypothetical protein SDRG_03352 [Saprolegnia diclina VS20]EQC39146.1 hypothetical protein SDRG_03352 [Saprolegnia diclina VS20]|eukprot:XP_008607207.1 hypothetical protein SDRG_03352 [Saprolegnia diclina VS20]
MERVLSALRSTETKTRLMGVNYVETFLDEEGWEEILTALVGCLSDNNAKVTQGSLRMLAKLIQSPSKPTEHIRGFFTLLWGPLKEKLGDSKAPIREAATDVLLCLIEKIGMACVLDRLRFCAGHKNWRIREQVLVCIFMAMERFRAEPQRICQDGLLEMALKLLEDSTKDVRDASLNVIHVLYGIRGESLLLELQSKNLRPAHMRLLMGRLGGEEAPVTSASSSTSSQPKRPVATIRPPSYSLPGIPVAATSPAKAKRSVSFSPPRSAPVVPVCAYTDKEVQQQMTIVLDGLAENQEWTTRVKSLQHLQSLVEKGATQSAVFATSLKAMRDRICDQVGDLRSTVTREACSTISSMAKALGDAFHPFVDSFIAALLKSVSVTIQIVAVSADSCVKNIIQSTDNGYPKAVPKFIDGARTKNNSIRLHCVEYLTLAWSTWDPMAFDRHTETMAILLPSIIGDAHADVRAAARKCFWAFHAAHPQRANQVLDELDASSRRRVVDEMATAPAAPASNARPASRKNALDAPSAAVGPIPSTVKTALPQPAVVPLGPRRVFNGSEHEAHASSSQVPSGPLRVPIPVRKQPRTDDRVDEAPRRNQALRVLNTNTSSVSTASHYVEVAPTPTYGGPLRVEVAPVSSRSTHPESTRRRASATDDNQRDDRPSSLSSELWEKRADDAMWSIRLETVDHLLRMAPSVMPPDAAKMVKIAMARIGDSHFRVAQSAMKLLSLLVPTHPSLVLPYLKTALPKVFAKLVDPKEGVREQATLVLEAIVASSQQGGYDASTLLSWIVPSMLDGPVKVKLLVYNCILQLLPSAPEFGNAPGPLRALVLKLADSIENDQASERGTVTVVTNVLEKICELYDASFSMVLQQLSPYKLGHIQKCINVPAPKLKRKHEKPAPPPSMLTSPNQPQDAEPGTHDWLAVLCGNNASREDKLSAMDKIMKDIRTQGASVLCSPVTNAIEWPRIVLALLDLALDNDSNEYKILQTKVMQTAALILATPEYASYAATSVESLVLQLLSRASSNSVLGLYFVEKFVALAITAVSNIASIRLLVALTKSSPQEDVHVQIALKVLKTAIDAIASFDALHVGEFDWIASAVVQTLCHANSGVRKNAVNCLVSLYFLGGSNFVPHLHALPPHYQKLVSLYIEKAQVATTQR